MVIRNIVVSGSLVSGSVGIMSHVQKDRLQAATLMDKVSHRCGLTSAAERAAFLGKSSQHPRKMGSNRTHLYRVPLKGRKKLSYTTVRRKQFSIVQARAIAIHKSQGGTYNEVVVDYSKLQNQKLEYVTLSRVTAFDGLYLTNKNMTIAHITSSISLIVPLPTNSGNSTSIVSKPSTPSATICWPPTSSQSAVSMCAPWVHTTHNADVASDFILTNTTALCFTDTWMDPNYPCNVDEYCCISAAKCLHNRVVGVARYVKREVQVEAVFLVQQVYECGEVCAIRLGNVVIACVDIAPETCMTWDAGLIIKESCSPA